MSSVVPLFTFGLILSVTLLSRPVATEVPAGGFHQASIMIEQLTANAKDLPVQSFDAF